jgi:hypothetical protein
MSASCQRKIVNPPERMNNNTHPKYVINYKSEAYRNAYIGILLLKLL